MLYARCSGPANPVSNLPINEMGGGQGGNHQSQGPFRKPVLDVVLWAEGPGWADGGWQADKLDRCPQDPRSLYRLSIPTFHFQVAHRNGHGSVYFRIRKRPSSCSCSVCAGVCDSHCITYLLSSDSVDLTSIEICQILGGIDHCDSL